MALSECMHHTSRGQRVDRAREWVREAQHGEVPEEPTPQAAGTEYFPLCLPPGRGEGQSWTLGRRSGCCSPPWCTWTPSAPSCRSSMQVHFFKVLDTQLTRRAGYRRAQDLRQHHPAALGRDGKSLSLHWHPEVSIEVVEEETLLILQENPFDLLLELGAPVSR